jgi:hypothetical protein
MQTASVSSCGDRHECSVAMMTGPQQQLLHETGDDATSSHGFSTQELNAAVHGRMRYSQGVFFAQLAHICLVYTASMHAAGTVPTLYHRNGCVLPQPPLTGTITLQPAAAAKGMLRKGVRTSHISVLCVAAAYSKTQKTCENTCIPKMSASTAQC